MSIKSWLKILAQVAMCVDRGIANGHSVFIHCMQGYNRSCALLCAWLCGGIRGPRMVRFILGPKWYHVIRVCVKQWSCWRRDDNMSSAIGAFWGS